MRFGLKGITKSEVITHVLQHNVEEFSFDLRPKSFNFTQAYNIVSILKDFSTTGLNYQLIFENEKDFVVKSVLEQIEKDLGEKRIFHLEFSGETSIAELDSYGNPYSLHFKEGRKIAELTGAKNLKRIIFHQKDLQLYADNNELYGFLQLFSDLDEIVEFEILMEWDSQAIYSMFDYFPIKCLSFEVNNQVELSYQTVDITKVTNHLDFIQNDLNT